MSFDSYKWIKSFKRSRAANRVSEAKLPDEGFSDPDQMREDQDTLKALYKKRADAARKGQTGLLNSLHKQIEKLTKKMKIESVNEAFIGPFVFGNTTKDDELKAMYDGALDGYANYKRGMVHPRSDYKRAYQAIEKLLKRRGIQVESFNEDSNIFSADDEQSWPSGPFGKKDDYADEAGSSYKRAKDWQIDKPGDNEDSKATGYKKVKN